MEPGIAAGSLRRRAIDSEEDAMARKSAPDSTPKSPKKELKGRKRVEASHETRRMTSAVRNPPPKRFSHTALGNR